MDTLFSLPDDATLYRALTERDAAYEGRAWVGVRTTGIFCRLTCPARKPRPENCQWFDSPAAALGAGFRPCLRCRPVAPEAEGDPVVRRMLEALASDPARRWTEAGVAALTAFLGGGVVLNVLKEEVPSQRQSRFWAFAGGAAGYAALLPAL